jgi:hypothetical protein
MGNNMQRQGEYRGAMQDRTDYTRQAAGLKQ